MGVDRGSDQDPGQALRDLTPKRAVIDGIPVFSLEVPGPMQAMLIFRVGIVDERAPTRGITHLVEHLAMSRLMQNFPARDRINARVEPLRTRFMASGTPQEVTQFLSEVAASLRSLPLERLESEKKVLRTEEANRTGGSVKAAWSWRFGASGLGLADFEEFGLRWLGAEQVGHWAASNFTAGNAVLWLSGPVPEDLRLELPHGERKPLPVPNPLPAQTPAIYQQGDRWVLLSMLGRRTTALYLGTRMLDARLRDRLRHEQSISYEVRASYQRIGPDLAEVTAFADSLAPNAAEAASALVAVTRGLAETGPTQDEIGAVLAERRHLREHPAAGLGVLEQAALEELDGAESKTLDEVEAEAEALAPEQVAQSFREAFESSFLAIPLKVPMNVPGFTAVPASIGPRIDGFRVMPMPGTNNSDVIAYSNEGVSLTQPNGSTIGMKWNDVAIAMWWSEGRRTLIANHGAGINILPAKWKYIDPLLEAMRVHAPPDRWVPMDEPDALPRQAGPVCAICEAQPAIEVTLQDPRSALMIWFKRVHGILCRDCGIAKFREVQRRVLLRGWWSIPGLLATPIALALNTEVWWRFRRLPVPIRTSGINPLPKGRTVWLSPGIAIPVVLVIVIAAYVLLPR